MEPGKVGSSPDDKKRHLKLGLKSSVESIVSQKFHNLSDHNGL